MFDYSAIYEKEHAQWMFVIIQNITFTVISNNEMQRFNQTHQNSNISLVSKELEDSK